LFSSLKYFLDLWLMRIKHCNEQRKYNREYIYSVSREYQL
jgi:hypothetical protein